ncbi:hypothetical protein O5O45_18455 [Hahella aquimaris]|uniref:XAC2610-related protein n=1 Tax=Hahella sp. HNIBRBA332 TaxID=3015983 RepID=UPI00273AE981|nr:hypothetical protein [Hahella sp. HNIBRBA332]WLQ11712.1 hypothetical protein O5O45_18455 [Hahella sp. HNIBRBA332]
MRQVYILLTIFLAACSQAQNQPEQKASPVICAFESEQIDTCHFEDGGNEISATLTTHLSNDDELHITAINISRGKRRQTLTLSPDALLLPGDRGYISFEDINFDNHADIAVTTSLGAANLYLDYWVYSEEQKRYVKVGNYPVFKLHPDTQTLTTEVRVNAAQYDRKAYQWRGLELVVVE